jgi:hypothetical protein
LLPYYQTDFRGYARIGGIQAFAEAYSPDWHLGYQLTTHTPQMFDWYWRLIAAANPIWVDDAGLTSFHSHTNYALFGGLGQLRGTLFANTPEVGKALCGRISLLGSYQPMWDASSHNYVGNIHAEIDYDLSGKKSPVTENCDGKDPSDATAKPSTFYETQSFAASLALTYDNGTDFSTYQKGDKFMLGLTLQY